MALKELTAEVTQLRETVEQHDQRLTVLEKKLDPKTREEHSKLELGMLLAELEGLGGERPDQMQST